MIIVTGGAGFIGTNLVRHLNSKGIEDIVIIDDLSDGKKFRNLKASKFNRYYDVDEVNIKTFVKENWVEKIYHLGAISYTDATDGKRVMKYNYSKTLEWIEASQSASVAVPLVIASSASVYGNDSTFSEDAKMDPLNLYAYSKALIDEYIMRAKPKDVWTFRPFNVYGQFEDHKDNQRSPQSKFAEDARVKDRIMLFEGSDKICRDFISVDDVVKIMVEYSSTLPGIYNLGTGNATSFLDVALQFTQNISYTPIPGNLVRYYQHYTKADTTRLRQLIGDYIFK